MSHYKYCGGDWGTGEISMSTEWKETGNMGGEEGLRQWSTAGMGLGMSQCMVQVSAF